MSHVYLFYPGHLGSAPVTQLREPGRSIVWDKSVKRAPAADAEDLVTTGGFVLALPLVELRRRFRLSAKQISELAIHFEVYQPREGEPVSVVPLTPSNLALLRGAPALGDSEE